MKVSGRYLKSVGILAVGFAILTSFQACSPGFSVLNKNFENGLGGSREDDLSYLIPTAPFEKLSQSGFAEFSRKTGAKNFWEFVSKFPLYSYGAEKQRWIYLPPNSQIDNSNPDSWIFPKGTVLWKLFSAGGRKIETRILEKVSDATGFAAWRASVYLWRADQSDADLLKTNSFYSMPEAEKQIYEAGRIETVYRASMPNQCVTCHQNAPDGALGMNYFQQSNSNHPRNVIALSNAGILKNTVVRFDEILGTDLQRAAIGYLQGNCAHCHSGAGPGPHDFKHRSTVTTAEGEAVLNSAARTSGLIVPANSAASRLHNRASSGSMPPATIAIDKSGVDAIAAWIDAM